MNDEDRYVYTQEDEAEHEYKEHVKREQAYQEYLVRRAQIAETEVESDQVERGQVERDRIEQTIAGYRDMVRRIEETHSGDFDFDRDPPVLSLMLPEMCMD